MPTDSTLLHENYAVVVAHPDDEALWFSSILDQASDIVIVFGDYSLEPTLGQGRKHALSKYPLATLTHLDIEESVSYNRSRWPAPITTDYGVELDDQSGKYKANYHTIVDALRELLLLKKPSVIFTHNPWGEYGHEDHIQVFRALNTLRNTFHFELFVSCYAHNKSQKFMKKQYKQLSGKVISEKTNNLRYQELKELYKNNQCWTWRDNYTLPDIEYFLQVSSPDKHKSVLWRPKIISLNWPKEFEKNPSIVEKVKHYFSRTNNV